MTDIQRVLRANIDSMSSAFAASEQARIRAEAHKQGYAHVMHERLMAQIAYFEATLKPTEEIGAYLAAFGTTVLIQISRVAFQDPYFIVFEGVTSDGQRAQLVQHVTQINVLFVAMAVEAPRKPVRIGFHGAEEQND